MAIFKSYVKLPEGIPILIQEDMIEALVDSPLHMFHVLSFFCGEDDHPQLETCEHNC